MANEFEIKDSGERTSFDGGMVRDTSDGKINFVSLTFGPMLRRWADHLTKGRAKYPDPEPGIPNWTLAVGREEYERFRESAARHFIAWLDGERDEDHAAGVYFNINGAEYVRDKMGNDSPTYDQQLIAEFLASKADDPRLKPWTILCDEEYADHGP